ncbi:MAG: GNAT family N-acetyltransferase [Deltaproteobacteria bacterium]|nr:GNAT family N-acetyltransferase [Deltaproteobacteria bacterium]MBI3294295.1 GNAT family N-acetyltransferase [Deltaproteobacteria bacterium]
MIRRLLASDLEAITGIGFEAWPRRDFQFFLNHGSSYNIGLWDGKVLVGFAMGLLVRGELDIVAVAVKESFRQKGLGCRLMHAYLLDERVESASLEVKEENVAAIRLYLKLGFSIAGRRKKYYEGVKDALVMSLSGRVGKLPEWCADTITSAPCESTT